MQDRFKFRVLINSHGKIEMLEVTQLDFEHGQIFFRREDGNEYNIGFGVDGVVLVQCTGLKDKNGKLIYEGDIFTVLHCGEKKAVVFWDDEQARFKVKNAAHNLFETIRSDYIEVVGNIYENPELLKEVRGE